MIPWANPLLENRRLHKEIRIAIDRVCQSGIYVNGPEVSNFEAGFARYLGASYAVGVANGTDSILLSLKALNIGPGDEVITVSHTAVATVAAIELAGAIPVLVDIEPTFPTIDPEQVERALSKRTKAVIAVHLYGQLADLSSLKFLCQQHGIFLLEDCCQAHGALYHGKKVGTFGDVSCFSFYPTKNLGCLGDGGMVVTQFAELAVKVRELREYGWRRRFISEIPGQNSRLDEIQAAILQVKLTYLGQFNEERAAIASFYDEQWKDLPIELPQERTHCQRAFHLYVISTESRERLRDHLRKQEILTGIHYPTPIHLQPAYKGRVKTYSMFNTERLAQRILSIPIYPGLTNREQERIAAAFLAVFNQ